MSRIPLIFFVVCLLLAGLIYLLESDEPRPPEAGISVATAMSAADTAGYDRVLRPRGFEFPADHGPHRDYKTEWWYFTGNLATSSGRSFGFQFTVFRTALSPDTLSLVGSWATRQLFMAHFAVSDILQKQFYPFERFSRGTLSLAGAQAQPFRVWVGDWEIAGIDSVSLRNPAMTLQAAEGAVALSLDLKPLKPLVLQGDRGLSKKGTAPGNASYYYSLSRIAAAGNIRISGKTYPVSGLAWMDREWRTSALAEDQSGWDWFSLQLENDYEIMYFQLRGKDGRADNFTRGTLILPDGTTRLLGRGDVLLTVLNKWTGRGGVEYPSGWRLEIPAHDIDLRLQPRMRNQEMTVTVRYWEGAVTVAGRMGNQPVDGYGYAELTGYADGNPRGNGR